MTTPKRQLFLPSRTPAYVDRETGAAELMISPETWDRWVDAGKLPKPAPGFPDNVPRWRWVDVDGRLVGKAGDDSDAFMEATVRVKDGQPKTSRHRGQRPDTFDLQAAEALIASGPTVMAEGALWPVEEYHAFVRSEPLNKRERATLAKLAEMPHGPADADPMKGGGYATMTRLEARGYVTASDALPDRSPRYFTLTPSGREAAGVSAEQVGRTK